MRSPSDPPKAGQGWANVRYHWRYRCGEKRKGDRIIWSGGQYAGRVERVLVQLGACALAEPVSAGISNSIDLLCCWDEEGERMIQLDLIVKHEDIFEVIRLVECVRG